MRTASIIADDGLLLREYMAQYSVRFSSFLFMMSSKPSNVICIFTHIVTVARIWVSRYTDIISTEIKSELTKEWGAVVTYFKILKSIGTVSGM
jgi:hypothetical protein